MSHLDTFTDARLAELQRDRAELRAHNQRLLRTNAEQYALLRDKTIEIAKLSAEVKRLQTSAEFFDAPPAEAARLMAAYRHTEATDGVAKES